MRKIFALSVILVYTIWGASGFARQNTVPEHIILNLTEKPAESVAVSWRTKSPAKQFVQWVNDSESPVAPVENQTLEAKANTVTYYDGDLPPLTVTNYSAIISGLKPKTQYLYRVGSENAWSEWFQFKTAGLPNEAFSFIYLGDAQNNLQSQWSRVIRKAYATAPDAGFIYHAGDLINRTNSENEWKEWFHAGDFIHATIPAMMTPGNHEYDSTALDNHWRHQFTLPENGPGLELLFETVYYVDYQDLRIVSIDADIMTESMEALIKTKEWLEKVLAENRQKWTILAVHFPFYSTAPNRDNPELREHFQPLIEKYGVDMVLSGHDHAYGRGMESISSMTEMGSVSGPVYVVSVSGPKMYGLSNKNWMSRKAGNTQLFQVLTIDGEVLNFKAYTATGNLYDEFDLIRQKGNKNKLVDKAPDVPERLYSR